MKLSSLGVGSGHYGRRWILHIGRGKMGDLYRMAGARNQTDGIPDVDKVAHESNLR